MTDPLPERIGDPDVDVPLPPLPDSAYPPGSTLLPGGVRCTASGQRRSWEDPAWVNGRGLCPDCGAEVEVWVRGSDLFPYAKTRAHRAPVGVTPSPYGVDGGPGRAT